MKTSEFEMTESSPLFGIKRVIWKLIIDAIMECDKVEDIILYGSRAKGNYRPFSDLDLTLVGKNLVHTDLFPILDRLDLLNLPYEIDLSLLSELDYPPLLKEIADYGQSLPSLFTRD